MGEELNEAVRAHEVRTAWEQQEAARELHWWFDLLNRQVFAGALPVGFLRFERSRRKSLASYRAGRNGVGALHDIRLNTLYVNQPRHVMVSALLHAMLHQWQGLLGTPAGSRSYHNAEFLAKARQVGIPSERWACYTAEYADPFLELLRREGVCGAKETPSPLRPGSGEGDSSLKKWRCGCTNLWAVVAIEAVCERCGRRFERRGSP